MSSEFKLSKSGEPQLLVGSQYLTRQELTNDLRVSLGFAIGGVTLTGGSVYATVKTIEGDVSDELEALAIGGGVFGLGLAMIKSGIGVAISSIRNRRSLKNYADSL
jgi:hypothetical protein